MSAGTGRRRLVRATNDVALMVDLVMMVVVEPVPQRGREGRRGDSNP